MEQKYLKSSTNTILKKHRLTKTPAANNEFAIAGFACKLGSLCFYLSTVFIDNFVPRNLPECKARKH